MKILITGAFSLFNKGDETRLESFVSSARILDKDCQLYFMSSEIGIEQLCTRLDVHLIRPPWILFRKEILQPINKISGALFPIGCLLIRFLRAALRHDILHLTLDGFDLQVDLSGESLSDYFGAGTFFKCAYNLLLGITSDRPIVLLSQSIGPFRNLYMRAAAVWIMGRAALIVLRDPLSREFVYDCNPNLVVAPDIGILLPAAHPSQVRKILNNLRLQTKRYTVFGIGRGVFVKTTKGENANQVASNALAIFSQLADHLVERTGLPILFIPHVRRPTEDDLDTASYIVSMMRCQGKAMVLRGDYTAAELKGIIGKSKFTVCTRFHVALAAISQQVPVLTLYWSHKVPSIFQSFGMLSSCVDMSSASDIRSLQERCDALLERRPILIQSELRKLRELAFESIRSSLQIAASQSQEGSFEIRQ